MNPHPSSSLALLALAALALLWPSPAPAARQPDGVSGYQNPARAAKSAQPYTQLQAVHPQTGAMRGAQRGEMTMVRGQQIITAKTKPGDGLEAKGQRTKDASVTSKKKVALVFPDQTETIRRPGSRGQTMTEDNGGKKLALAETFSTRHRSVKMDMTTPAVHARRALPRGGEKEEYIFHNSSYTRRVHVAQQTVEHKSPWSDPSAKHAVKVLPGKEGMAKLRGTQNVFASSRPQPASSIFVPAGKRRQQGNQFFQNGAFPGTNPQARGSGTSRAAYR